MSLDISTSQVADRDIFASVISGRDGESGAILGAIWARLIPSSGKIWSRCGVDTGGGGMMSGEWVVGLGCLEVRSSECPMEVCLCMRRAVVLRKEG